MRINHLVYLLFFVQNSPNPKTKRTLRFMWPLNTFLILSSNFPTVCIRLLCHLGIAQGRLTQLSEETQLYPTVNGKALNNAE